MYYVTTEASFDAAHFLNHYEGKCHNIHGHRWRIVVKVQAEHLMEDQQNKGMVIDFKHLKDDLKAVADAFDHTFIYEKGSLKAALLEMLIEEGFSMTEVAFRPTAENFSKYIYDVMTERGYHVAEAVVYETPNNCAAYA